MSIGYSKAMPWLSENYPHWLSMAERFGRTFPRQPDGALPRLMVREAAVREMLGRWVSELEPMLLFDADGFLYGMAPYPGAGGVIHAHEIVPTLTIKGGVPI